MTYVSPRRPPLGAGGWPRPEPKIDIGIQWRPETHHSGWPYALDALASLHMPGGVVLEGFIEKKFAWGGDPGDLRNDPRPHIRPWVGFWHNPPNVHESFNRVGHAPGDILDSWLWRESAPHCLGLFTLSRYLKRWLEERVSIPVCSLLHPTGRPSAMFGARRYATNPRRKIVQVGWWLRRIESLYNLDVPSLEKVVLNPFPQGSSRHSDEGWADYGRYRGVTQLAYLDHHGYDLLLAENIVFLDLYDSSANNAIVECIARLTPILVNPLPAVVEYLGEGYPFYFTDLGEAAAKAQNMRLVVAAYQYLRDAPVRQRLTGDQFRQAFVQSRIYRDLPPPPEAGRQNGLQVGRHLTTLTDGWHAQDGIHPPRTIPRPVPAPAVQQVMRPRWPHDGVGRTAPPVHGCWRCTRRSPMPSSNLGEAPCGSLSSRCRDAGAPLLRAR